MAISKRPNKDFKKGEQFRVLYMDDRYLGIETEKGDHTLLDDRRISDYHALLRGSIQEWGRYRGKHISWINKDYWEIVDDPCGNCKNRCRSDKPCELYQGE